MMKEMKILILILLNVVAGQGTCFKLDEKQKQFLRFDFDDLDLSRRTNIGLSFKTVQTDAVLYYVEGVYREKMPLDYEGLFIHNGKLNYFVFNPTTTGASSSFGSHVITDYPVNNDKWMNVKFFRNVANETGIIVNGNSLVIPGNNQVLDIGRRVNGQTFVQIFIGGHPSMERISTVMKTFDGELKNIKDISSNKILTSPANDETMYEKFEC